MKLKRGLSAFVSRILVSKLAPVQAEFRLLYATLKFQVIDRADVWNVRPKIAKWEYVSLGSRLDCFTELSAKVVPALQVRKTANRLI